MYAVEALKAALGEDIAAWAQGHQIPLVGMFNATEELCTSRIGGVPDLATDEQWPVFDEKAVFVCQIDFAELPAEVREVHPMPEKGLLRVFAPTEADQETGAFPVATVMFTASDTIAREEGEGTPVRFELGVDYPNDAAQCSDWPWSEDSYDQDTYAEIIENQHPYQYLFGYPWQDDTPTPEGMLPLLTLFDEEALWIEGEVLQLFIKRQDLAAGDFSNVQAEIRMPY